MAPLEAAFLALTGADDPFTVAGETP